MITELACGHAFLWEGWPPDTVDCSKCHQTRPVVAIECREWKATCSVCRYARWCGQSQGEAIHLRNRHQANCRGPVMVDYLVHPDSEKRVKSLYKGVKPRIMGDCKIHDYEAIGFTECTVCGLTAECRCVPF